MWLSVSSPANAPPSTHRTLRIPSIRFSSPSINSRVQLKLRVDASRQLLVVMSVPCPSVSRPPPSPTKFEPKDFMAGSSSVRNLPCWFSKLQMAADATASFSCGYLPPQALNRHRVAPSLLRSSLNKKVGPKSRIQQSLVAVSWIVMFSASHRACFACAVASVVPPSTCTCSTSARVRITRSVTFAMLLNLPGHVFSL